MFWNSSPKNYLMPMLTERKGPRNHVFREIWGCNIMSILRVCVYLLGYHCFPGSIFLTVPVPVLELIQVVWRFRVRFKDGLRSFYRSRSSSRTKSSLLAVPGPVLELTKILAGTGSGNLRYFLTDLVFGSDVDFNTWCNWSHLKAKFLDNINSLNHE